MSRRELRYRLRQSAAQAEIAVDTSWHRRCLAAMRATLLFILLAMAEPVGAQQPLALVNPFIGADGGGNTVPGAAVPFGFVSLSPDTSHGSTSGYDSNGL